MNEETLKGLRMLVFTNKHTGFFAKVHPEILEQLLDEFETISLELIKEKNLRIDETCRADRAEADLFNA